MTGKPRPHFRKSNGWKYLCAIVIICIYLLPIYVVVVTSLKPVTDMSSRLLPPSGLFLDNYARVLNSGGMLRAIGNTLIITIGAVLIEVVVGCMAAYPLARNRSRFNKIIKSLIMGVMMVPALSIVVGVYSTLVSMKAINSYWGIIMVISAFGLPLSVFLYANFITSIPVSLDEAAAIDGASIWQTFFHVILPQLKPVTVSVIIMKGVGAWNEYAYSLYVLQKPSMYTVTLIIKSYFSEHMNDLNAAAAGAVLGIVPVIAIYLVLQKYFVQGTLDSAIKG